MGLGTQLEFTHLIDSFPGMVWTARPDGQVEFISRRWCEFTGLSLDEANGLGWNMAIHPDDRSGLLEGWRLVVASGQSGRLHARLRRHDGVYRRFLINASPIKDASGHVVSWCAASTDIEDPPNSQEALPSRSRVYDSVRNEPPQALRDDESYARLIVDSIPCLVAIFTPTGDVEYVNRQVLDYFGRKSEELADWRFGDVVHPEDLPRAIEVFSRSLASGDPFEFEVRARRHDGVYRWLQSRGSSLRDQNGRIVRWHNLLIDIDERKRAEEALEARGTELRRAHYHLSEGQRLSQTGSFTSDPTADEHTWSDEFYRICEFDSDQQASIQTFRNIVHHEDRSLYDSVIEQAQVGRDFDVVFRIVTPKGTLKHLRGVGRVVELIAGRPVFVGAIQDVTESKLVEEALKARAAELRRAYEFLKEGQRLSGTGTFITDLVAEEHNWSEELLRMFEIDPATKVTVPLVRDLVVPEDLPSFDDAIGRSMHGRDFDLTFRIRTTQGNTKHLHAVAHVTEEIAGRPLFIGAIQDVTQSKLSEQALNMARNELAHVSRVMTLGTLTASIAHEVNQPLAGIINNANTCLHLLAGSPPNLEGVRATAQRMLRDGNRAAEVIHRLRTLFSRKEAKNEAVDLNDAAREVLAMSSNELQRSGVILRTDFDESEPVVMGDRVQLQQVMLNLVLNAADAMIKITERPRDLLVATTREGKDRVRLWVRDSGVGIDPKSSEKLFEPFYTTKSHGMGVGLSISRSIVESHHGSLWATANNGAGATFSFSLPCRVLPTSAADDDGG